MACLRWTVVVCNTCTIQFGCTSTSFVGLWTTLRGPGGTWTYSSSGGRRGSGSPRYSSCSQASIWPALPCCMAHERYYRYCLGLCGRLNMGSRRLGSVNGSVPASFPWSRFSTRRRSSPSSVRFSFLGICRLFVEPLFSGRQSQSLSCDGGLHICTSVSRVRIESSLAPED